MDWSALTQQGLILQSLIRSYLVNFWDHEQAL